MQIFATVAAFEMGTTFEQATASAAGHPPIIPAEYAHLIWSVIYAGSVCDGIYQYSRSRERGPLLLKIRRLTASAFAATVCWPIAARFNLTGLTVACVFWLASSLVPAFLNLPRPQQKLELLDRAAIPSPLSINTGWVTVAVFANLSAFLHQHGLLDVVLTPMWWAVGILLANLTRSYHPQFVLTCVVVIAADVIVLASSRRRNAVGLDCKAVR